MTVLTSDVLKKALHKACSSFAPDELAYLALTSKPELPIRDRLAWVLHRELPGSVAAREWNPGGGRARSDLAVLQEETHEPLALVEMKAAYTFDFARAEQLTVEKYRRYIADDLDKAHQAGGTSARVFGLLLLTHPASPPRQPTPVVKYGREIARALSGRTPDELSGVALENARRCLAAHGTVEDGTLHAGRAFGIDVDVKYLLVSRLAVRSAGT
ncbi:hypothetical protein [Streptomyces sp. NPDC096030]|uniref:hypothetical protein n=1 Tax=Streptomyces sp. NPDC096030 TaxID=3155423 RepID=UPI00332B4E82